MSKVIDINTERWTTVFSQRGVKVRVSTWGSIDFLVKDSEDPTVMALSQALDMTTAMAMFQALATAFGTEQVSGKDEANDGRPDPAV